MNTAPQVQTVEITDAELDGISGGLAPHVSLIAGPAAISDSSLLAEADMVKNEALGATGQFHQAGVSVTF